MEISEMSIEQLLIAVKINNDTIKIEHKKRELLLEALGKVGGDLLQRNSISKNTVAENNKGE